MKLNRDQVADIVSAKIAEAYSIDSYHIDGRNVLHTFIGDKAHVTISDVVSDEQANQIIDELNNNL